MKAVNGARLKSGPEADVFDVAVVGAGPTGLTAALLLAEKGWRVCVLERWPTAYERPRAIAFDFEAARIFQNLKIVDEVLEVTEQGGDEYDWRNADDERLLVIDHSGAGPTGWPRISIFSQPQLEAILTRRAERTENIRLIRGVEATSLTRDDDGVTLGLRPHPGIDGEFAHGRQDAPATVRASYVIGCDGANSFVRENMDTSLVDLGFFYDWLIVDVIPHEKRDWRPRSLQICDPKRPTTVVPGGPGRRRWEFMVLPGESLAEMNTEATAWKLLEPWNLHAGNATLERHTVYTFQARWASKWNDGRLLLAGDSAHLMPPFAGQGLCSGLRDAANLAWKLDLVLRGAAAPGLLDTYTEERVRHIQFAIHYSIELGKVICVLDPAEAAERDRRMIAHRGAPDKVLPKLPKASFESGVVRRDADGTPLAPAGELAPQFTVAGAGGTGLFDDVVGGSFAVLSRARLAGQLGEENRAFLESVGCRVIRLLPPGGEAGTAAEVVDTEVVDTEVVDTDVMDTDVVDTDVVDTDVMDTDVMDTEVVDVERRYEEELRRLESEVVLVRPDGYYFGAAKSVSDADALVDDLRAIVTGRR